MYLGKFKTEGFRAVAERTQEEALSKEQLIQRRLDHLQELQELYKVR